MVRLILVQTLRIFLPGLILLGITSTQAASITIDFQQIEDQGVPVVLTDDVSTLSPPVFTSNGFTFTQTGGKTGIVGELYNSQQGRLLAFCPNCAPEEGFVLEGSNGQLFSIHSFYYGMAVGSPGELTIIGTYADDTQIINSLVSSQPWHLMEQFVMDTEWSGLKSVSFTSVNVENNPFGSAGFDTIVVTSTPIPAALWLFGSALGMMGFVRRQSNRNAV